MIPIFEIMKTSPPSDDDEPLVVLVLFVLAGICVLAGLASGVPAGTVQAFLMGSLFGCSGALGFWALAVIIRLLHRIERNTRR